MITLHNIINGRPGRSTARRATLPFFDPATGVQLGTAPDSDAATVDRAFQAAHTAFQSYKRTTPAERQAMMLKLADLIEANVDRLLDAEVACTGKPRAGHPRDRDPARRGPAALLRRRLPRGVRDRADRIRPRASPPPSGGNRSAWSPRSPRGTTRS